MQKIDANDCMILFLLKKGNFTINDAYTLLPFSNTMVNIIMTGQQIHNVLEDAIDFYLDPSGSWGAYPRSAGLRYDVNEAMEKGSRVSNLEVNVKLAGIWGPIDLSESYTVVTNNFIATPRDGYYEFGNIAEDLVVDTYVEYAQSFVDYAKSVQVLEPVDEENGSTQSWSDSLPMEDTPLTPDETVPSTEEMDEETIEEIPEVVSEEISPASSKPSLVFLSFTLYLSLQVLYFN